VVVHQKFTSEPDTGDPLETIHAPVFGSTATVLIQYIYGIREVCLKILSAGSFHRMIKVLLLCVCVMCMYISLYMYNHYIHTM
jgi:hypothetical protein